VGYSPNRSLCYENPMQSRTMTISKLLFSAFLLFAVPLGFSHVSWAESDTRANRVLVSVEGDLTWQTRNDNRIPGTTGTRFDLADFDTGPFPAFRLYAGYTWNDRHQLRFLYAPLGVEVNGQFAQAVSFQGVTFAAGTATTGYYQFNSYRATYAYHFEPTGSWRFALGFTAKIRDAEVRLTQGGQTATKKNVGFVPLLNFQAAADLGDGWTFRFDLDGLAAPQGRAFDGAVFAERLLTQWESGQTLSAFAGYRTIEGGADNDEVLSFAWVHKAVLGVRCGF
jgi:hypothetical protein